MSISVTDSFYFMIFYSVPDKITPRLNVLGLC